MPPFIERNEYIKYSIFCVTEDTTVQSAWILSSKPVPTTCPNDRTHSIDSAQTSIVSVRDSNAVSISVSENEDMCMQSKIISIGFTAAGNAVTTAAYTSLFPLSIMSVSMQTIADQEGDSLSVLLEPGELQGYLTADAAIGDTTLAVSPDILQKNVIGFMISAADGVNTNDLGYVESMDGTYDALTVTQALTSNFAAATPTSLYTSIPLLDNIEFGPAQKFYFGQANTRMAKPLIKNETILCQYTNTSATTKHAVLYFTVTW